MNQLTDSEVHDLIQNKLGWRAGQFIFNFLEWLRHKEYAPANQSDRLADTFHMSDEDFEKYGNEYLNELQTKTASQNK